MCGINGYVRPGRAPAELDLVERMNAALHHRGPDEGGVRDVGFGVLGMRRLSIVDLRSGSQPMSSPGGEATLVYNGELYDHDELRAELAGRGWPFRTRSDTEALLAAFTTDGLACLPRLNGMFGFAHADRARERLVLARDPVGIKPLYYHVAADGELVFSSELGALLAHPRVPRRLDRRSLATLLVDRFIGAPWTLFDGVHELPPGHVLLWHAGRVEIRSYEAEPPPPGAADEAQALAELRQRLDQAVRSQLVADVPVGVFLSGGIDSSTVAAYAARALDRPVKSFSVAVGHPDFDESEIAREVARHLGSEHHEVRLADEPFSPAFLDRIVDHVGQPLADLSCIPTWIVSRFAREEVKVVLSGDGGDEFFGGYDHVRWAARVRRAAERTPAPLRRLAQGVLAGVAPLPLGALETRARRARKGLALTFHAPQDQLRRMCALWAPEEVPRLLADGTAPRDWPAGQAGELDLSPEEHAMRVLARTSLPGAILAKVDRMSMAASLEVRVPLLDRRIVEFARRLPLELKLRGARGKHLLREAGRPLLPAVLYEQPKRGFGLPLFDWLTDEFWQLVGDAYAPGSRAAALFEPRALERTLAEGRAAHAQGGRLSAQSAAGRVWLLAQLARWIERWEVSL